MVNVKFTFLVKRAVDVLLCLILLFLMAYQVTGEKLHEYLGTLMVVLVLVHQFLNRKWYASIFKGRYRAYRILMTAVNVLLLISFILTAISGMVMSSYSVPFMYGLIKSSLARVIHLGMSYWSFVLMGLHLGLHISGMTATIKTNRVGNIIFSSLFILVSGIGLHFIISNKIATYLFFRNHFAFLDYEKSAFLVFLENVLMLLFCSFIGNSSAILCQKKVKGSKRSLFVVLSICLVFVIGVLLSLRCKKIYLIG